jgi:UDP-N-acetylglucosamine transferase subunit ALG13
MTGTHNQGFERLIKAADELAASFPEKFFIQTGASELKPKNCKWKKFLSPIELEKKIQESSLIITHAGAGSIINSLKNKKPTVVVPREKKFSEHINDHQIELAEKLERKKKAVTCRNLNELRKAIKKAKNLKAATQKNKEIIKEIELFLGK